MVSAVFAKASAGRLCKNDFTRPLYGFVFIATAAAGNVTGESVQVQNEYFYEYDKKQRECACRNVGIKWNLRFFYQKNPSVESFSVDIIKNNFADTHPLK
ncbi:hypothetical protein CHX27_04245 [Flavobacterium aurantiibacter]|uniref:Uncharacterized protein n=1 Tax=Flavobacterium aurantiibacter TaxID=2023067 RepID=A0A255ZYC6_9FLAO|nr:hypothetical protein CHX27_04245 [Flavobacterium aurantiibacter]